MEINFKNVNFNYQLNTPFSTVALEDVSFNIPSGSFTSIIGHTGSGKSTVLQLIDGLLTPASGDIKVGDFQLNSQSSQKHLKNFRKNIGFIFQFSENQLFEETVEKDLIFGPKNFGVDEKTAKENARRILKIVDLPETILQKSQLDLSGGQRRRVAIAATLISDPQLLLLDEPVIGLDPSGRDKLMALFKRLNQQGKTIVMISHEMDDVADYSDQIIVLNAGRVSKIGSPKEIFSDENYIRKEGLRLPSAIEFANQLQKTGFPIVNSIKNKQQLLKEIKKQFKIKKAEK
ncbi:energy-coupling factor transporter ATPase [Oenococcus sp. UCMA 16435]|nr:energy-coupling factor transporter ATPase [Oenococcus sp. UCMA 16435]MDI4584970.1 energy-coupling factor transporter ATPase [Oenococcus sp. UCMA 14587]